MPRRLSGILWLLLVAASVVRAQGEATLLYIGREAVGLDEFIHYYHRSGVSLPEAYLPSFVDYKLKAFHARTLGVDTLPAFRLQLASYKGALLRRYLEDGERLEEHLRARYERAMHRFQANGWVKLAHISKHLSPDASRAEEAAARAQMDSVYAALQAGSDFEKLALGCSEDSMAGPAGGILPWMPLCGHVQEWNDRLRGLERGVVSPPFVSPLGVHIVKWLDKRERIPYEEWRNTVAGRTEELVPVAETFVVPDDSTLYARYPDLRIRMQEVKDGLLVAFLSSMQQGVAYQESDLERYFHRHRTDYAWELPRYKGAVIHCRDKKTASIIRKNLKKKPMEEWETALATLSAGASGVRAQMETGVFAIGKNPYVDRLVFKCGNFDPLPDLPYTFVLGRKLKRGPETYEDVYDDVRRDYLAAHGNDWLEKLKETYKVEINQEVLKTVNNKGSN